MYHDGIMTTEAPTPARWRVLWLLCRSNARRPLSAEQRAACLDLFTLRHPDVPPRYRELWLIEEAREDIATSVIELGRAGFARGLVCLFACLRGHLKLWLLLKAVRPDTEMDRR
jgi:hypothetical protein